MAYLIITNGLDQGQLFELSTGQNFVGRDEDADIQISLSAVSRQHACLNVRADHVTIQDLESANGTNINNPDTDGDGEDDRTELEQDTNPNS